MSKKSKKVMQVTHIQKYIHTSPRKLRLVADMARSMRPVQAVTNLQFVNKKSAKPLMEAIKTALANARVQNLDTEVLSFKVLEVNEASRRVTRVKSSGFGRFRPYSKLTSHIRIVLTDEVMEKSKTKKMKLEKGDKN